MNFFPFYFILFIHFTSWEHKIAACWASYSRKNQWISHTQMYMQKCVFMRLLVLVLNIQLSFDDTWTRILIIFMNLLPHTRFFFSHQVWHISHNTQVKSKQNCWHYNTNVFSIDNEIIILRKNVCLLNI
jgi:predicted membrane channel-forming protein YqfA (hemolysin III family)